MAAGYTIYRGAASNKWCVVELPDEWARDDVLPPKSFADRWYDRLPPWAHVAQTSVTPPAVMGGTRGSGRSRESGNRPALGHYQQVVVLIRDARDVAERLTHALAEGVDRRAKGVIGIQYGQPFSSSTPPVPSRGGTRDRRASSDTSCGYSPRPDARHLTVGPRGPYRGFGGPGCDAETERSAQARPCSRGPLRSSPDESGVRVR